ncbi:ABC transporter permease [Rubrimonas cliftonensis]|uniref:Putative spermidine/putrescine transport system permease protein n=1 Tax=Rubrimonas cliftonensis TaxID=89524 RepID=A0A1H3WX92_9RHOB|nr:ABC transporter permease [Rubrimonas cliftonensis]SDZ90828.1 putative spermidine/putrescine transport system permease protein [Rubrimonas cliftonensis]
MTAAASDLRAGAVARLRLSPPEWPLVAPLGLIFVGFFLAPLALLVWTSMHADAEMTRLGPESWMRFLGDPFYLKVAADTLLLGLKTVALTLVLGVAIGLIFLEASPAQRTALLFIIILPLLLSVVVRTFAWIVILGSEGVVSNAALALGLTSAPFSLLQTELGLIISLAQIELPLMLLPLLSVMGRIDPNLLDASRALGASRWRTLWRVILPLSAPGLTAGCLLVFASSTAAFISQSVIGGGRLIYMPLVIWQQSIVVYNWPFAAVVSLCLLISVLGVIGVIHWLGRRVRA